MGGIVFCAFGPFYMGLRAGATTRTNTSTSTCAAPARKNVRGAGVDRGAGRQHIVDQHQVPTGNLDPVFRPGQEMPLGRYRRARFETVRPAAVWRGSFEPAMRDRDAAIADIVRARTAD